MFYNSYRATNSARKEMNKKFLKRNPSQRLLNKHKREKLKDLLLQKFMQTYQVPNQEGVIEGEVSKFVEKERLNDVDLQQLNNRIKTLLKQKSSDNLLRNKLTRNIPDNLTVKPNLEIKDSSFNIEEFKHDNQQSSINRTNANITLPKIKQNVVKSQPRADTIANCKKNTLYKKNKFQTQEEELAELEEQLKKEEEEKLCNRKRLDFSKEGDEWNAISKYNKKLFENQLIETKIRNNEVKKRIKEYLDIQVNEKIKKEFEDEMKDKEYSKIIQENLKKMNEIDKIKEEKIKNQILREKKSRDEILKNINLKKKIEELKEKKIQREYVKTIKEKLEMDRKKKFEEKKQKNEELNRAIKENEIKKAKMKEEMIKEKKLEMDLLEEQLKQEDKSEKEREHITQKIYCNGNKYIIKQAEENLKKLKENEKKEEEKFLYYYNEKRKKEEEDMIKEKIRKNREKTEWKKFLDRQIEEKQKEKEYFKIMDYQQAKIWDIDIKKYNEEEKMVNKKIKDMNKTNFNFILKQISSNKQIKQRNGMTDNEYFMNKDLLEKAKASL